MHNLSWDDLRFILAVAEAGSVNAAARRLGVNHATVLRRIAAFEARNAVTLFERSQQGYRLAPAARQVLDALREVEGAVFGVQRTLSGQGPGLHGEVRVTSTDSLSLHVLPPILAEFRSREPHVFIDLVATNAHLDLSRLDAEVTVRPAARLPDGLAGTAPAKLGFAAYAAAEAALPDPAAAAWIAPGGAAARSLPGLWLAETVPRARMSARADSFLVAAELAAAGMGLAVLPCVVGDADARLRRVPGAMPPMAVDLWVACHADLEAVPRIRAVRGFLVAGLGRLRPRLLGDDGLSPR